MPPRDLSHITLPIPEGNIRLIEEQLKQSDLLDIKQNVSSVISAMKEVSVSTIEMIYSGTVRGNWVDQMTFITQDGIREEFSNPEDISSENKDSFGLLDKTVMLVHHGFKHRSDTISVEKINFRLGLVSLGHQICDYVVWDNSNFPNPSGVITFDVAKQHAHFQCSERPNEEFIFTSLNKDRVKKA